MSISLIDFCAFCFFFISWSAYGVYIDKVGARRPGLNTLMHGYRDEWMGRMANREVRIVDTAIMNALQNGTAFFASTSLLAIGGAAALLRASDDVVRLYSDLTLGASVNRSLWEIKVLGLAYIYGYAFFKFAWAYRLFNYSAILVGATPAFDDPDKEARERAAKRAGKMNIVAGRHFLIGQRAMFFSFGYLGWFISPWALAVTTCIIIFVIYRRQFASDALDALLETPEA
jgi:uncharacterized membrane protein